LRRYGGKMAEENFSRWEAGRRSCTRGCCTGTGPMPCIWIQDSSSTTGAGLTGLVFNSTSLVAYYTFTGTLACGPLPPQPRPILVPQKIPERAAALGLHLRIPVPGSASASHRPVAQHRPEAHGQGGGT